MTQSNQKLVSYRDARAQIRDGDLLLFRRAGLIARAGRGRHSHAAKCAWWGDDLFCVEIREWHGGRAVTLSSQVRRHNGRIDLFEVNPDQRWPHYDRAGATAIIRRLAGCSYGYWGVAAAALRHLPLVRLLVPADMRDEYNSALPPFCSQACAMSDRIGGGVDPVPHLADRLTLPADLARSPLYRYRFTLTL